MAEEVNLALSSPLINSSTDQLHQSLRLLVRKIRAQLEVLTKKNKLKEEENDLLRNELSDLKEQIPNLQSVITTKTATEAKLNDDLTELSTQFETESQRHSTIESELLKQLSALRQDKEDLLTTHQIQTEQLIQDHDQILKGEKQNFDNLQHQKLSVDTKLQEIMQSNDVLHSKLKELQNKQQNLSAMTNTEKNELETKMEQLKSENIDYLSKIQQLKNAITDKDQEIHDIGMSMVSMQNDLHCMQTQSKSKNQIVNEYQSKLKQSNQDLHQYKTQYKQLQETVNKLMDIAKDMGSDSFWSTNDGETPQESDINEETRENDEVLMIETTAHPFAPSPTNIMTDATDTEHSKRLQWMQMLPKRVTDLQTQLKEAHHRWIKEKETTAQVTTYWKTKLKELNAKNTDLCQRMEDLERMVDSLSSHNDRLIKENDALKAEMHNAKFTSSAHEIYLQMKTKEETEKTIELQQELDVLQDELLRKSALISKLEKSNMITKQSMMEQKKLHQTEMLQLTNKLNVLTQLSQEEIQQTFHLTIQELQSILDQHDVVPTDIDAEDLNHVLDEKKTENEMDSQHLLSPKLNDLKVPHITDSDTGDNDDAEIIEAEDKLASYFARHKQRQLMMCKDKQSVSVEPIKEVNEENDSQEAIQPQIVEIVDGDVEDEDENILTPPLQEEELPYIVPFDDALLIDPTMVSESNVEVSNCSTRGNSTPGDQSSNSVKIDEPPTKADDDDDDVEEEDEDVNLEDNKPDENKQELEDTPLIASAVADGNDMDRNDEMEREAKNEDNETNVPQFTAQTEQKADDEVRILHSLQTYLSNSTGHTTNTLTSPQPLQQRARSLGSVATTGDDLQSVDQSMLAHDGSRDGSVVPEPAMSGAMYGDEPDEELITADIETTNSNVPPLPNPSEYVATPEVTGTETIHSLEMNSVDEIHHEAHQIIDQLQENLKDLQSAERKVPTIVQEHESMDNQITNDDILGPLIERQQNHSHDSHDHEKNKKILNAAKAKWSRKVEEMIANTDAWFINEDGDIVLIYPEADNIEGNKERKDKSKVVEAVNENTEIAQDMKDDGNNVENDTANEEERTKEEEERKVDDSNCEDKLVDNVEDKMEDEIIIMNEKNENECEDRDKTEQSIVVESNSNDRLNANNDTDNVDNNVTKNENFFNSFRIF